MSTITLTAATFEQTVTDNDIVLVDFWAASVSYTHLTLPTIYSV